jgi:hypothetical protein
VKQASSGQNGAAMHAAPACADRRVPLDHSSILAAKAELISDRKLASDSRSLFDAVPSFDSFCGPQATISIPPPKQREKEHGKRSMKGRDGLANVAYRLGKQLSSGHGIWDITLVLSLLSVRTTQCR